MTDYEDTAEEERNKAAEQGTAALQIRRPPAQTDLTAPRRTVSKRVLTAGKGPMSDYADIQEREKIERQSKALPRSRARGRAESNGF